MDRKLSKETIKSLVKDVGLPRALTLITASSIADYPLRRYWTEANASIRQILNELRNADTGEE